MGKERESAAIGKILNELYPAPAIPLKHQDPYTLLIAGSFGPMHRCAGQHHHPVIFKKGPTRLKRWLGCLAEIEASSGPVGWRRESKAISELSHLARDPLRQGPRRFEALEDLLAWATRQLLS